MERSPFVSRRMFAITLGSIAAGCVVSGAQIISLCLRGSWPPCSSVPHFTEEESESKPVPASCHPASLPKPLNSALKYTFSGSGQNAFFSQPSICPSFYPSVPLFIHSFQEHLWLLTCILETHTVLDSRLKHLRPPHPSSPNMNSL